MASTRKRRVTLPTSEQADDSNTGRASEMTTRASKRRRLALSNNTESEEIIESVKTSKFQPKIIIDEIQQPVKPPSTTKVKRQSWTSTGIGIFFEALAEHGKDFGKILKYMCAKEKKKKQRDPFIVNLSKNQVRFFYYRTWHKVSSLLALAERGNEATNQKRSQKGVSSSIPSVEAKGGASDEETEGETEAVFDMSLDEGEDSQDSCHLTPSGIIEDGDMVPSTGQYDGPSSPNMDEPIVGQGSFGKDEDDVVKDVIIGDSTDVVSVEEIAGIDENSTGTVLTACFSNVGCDSRVIGDNDVTSDSCAVGDSCATSGGQCDKDAHETIKNDKKKSEGIGAGSSLGGGGEVKVNGVYQSLDLVAMICYSKLRQKCRGDKYVLGRKLRELIYNGTTTIRLKGKRKKEIKIPNCTALGSNKTTIVTVSEPTPVTTTDSLSPVTNIPMTLELHPLNSTTWSYVQQLSMNPRIRINVSLSRTVSDVFHLMGSKWHILPKDVFNVLRLFKSPLLPEEESTVPSKVVTEVHHSQPLSSTACCDTNLDDDGGVVSQLLDLPPSMTVQELKQKLFPDKSKISLQYEITSQNLVCPERNLEQLMKMADFLASSYQPPCTPVLSASPLTPPPLQTPINHAKVATPSSNNSVSSSVKSSPIVKQYIKNLPKRSPIKSPLAKYKRMKQLRPSPLKTGQSSQTTSTHSRIKPVQLQFPSVQTTSALSSTSGRTMKDSIVNSVPVSIAQSSAKTSKAHGKTTKQPQLVTLSNNSLKQSGSFTGLRLDDLFQTVNENFKGAQSKKNRSSKTSSAKSSRSKASANLNTLLLSDNQDKQTATDDADGRLTTPTDLLGGASQADVSALVKASPLEKLASQVLSKQIKESQYQSTSPYQINITTTGVATPTVSKAPPTIASPTGRPIITTSLLSKSKRNASSQRPVVPKPLMYLPQFTQQLASLQPGPQSQSVTLNQSNLTATSSASVMSSKLSTQPSTATQSIHALAPPTATPVSVSSQNALNTQELLHAQVALLKELLSKPVSRNEEDEQKRQQAVQTLLQSLLVLGTQYPALLQNLDLKALLSAAQSKPGPGTIKSTVRRSDVIATTAATSKDSITDLLGMADITPPSSTPVESISVGLSTPVSVGSGCGELNMRDLPIYTNTDTVSELLKGLSPNEGSNNDNDSVTRLSEETSDVLPNFAQAMMRLRNESTLKDTQQSNQHPAQTPVKVTTAESEVERDSSGSSLGTLLNGLIPPAPTDNVLDMDLVPGGSGFNTTDYTEVFSQLKDILSTPEKSKSCHREIDGYGSSPIQNKSSLEDLLGIFNSPFKGTQTMPCSVADQPQDADRSLLDENSIDYISKFKELASSMNASS